MRVRNLVVALVVCGGVALFVVARIASAQASARGATQAPGRATAQASARGGSRAPGQAQGNLAQVMRGILFPNSNVISAIQSLDPTSVKPEADTGSAINPLASTYGGWQAVESSGIALAEAASLLTIPGRGCSNGRPVPVQNADWAIFVQGLRETGMAAYKAAQAKDQDAFLEVSDKIATACGNCHDVYREKTSAQGGLGARCTK